LHDYNTNVIIYDPWAKPEEVMHEYSLKVVNELPKIKYSAIILAVAHEKFKNLDIKSFKLSEDSVVYDVKGFLPREIADEIL